MLMFYCELEVGNYRLDVMAGSSLNPIEEHVSQVLIKNLSIKQAPDSQYNVQIRESLTQKQRAIMFICLFAGLFLFIKGLFTVIHLGLGIAMEGSLA
jgi:hypoxanthine-guanine phosphoribosyltransferase